MDVKERELLTKELNAIISGSLAGPTGDPDSFHRWAAARAFGLLKKLGLPIDGEEEWAEYLRPSPENGNTDYLKWALKE
jgi:hypothetical protein